METTNVPAITLVDALIQWLFFLVLLFVIFLPAFKFRILAKKFSRNGWVYFIIGLAVGILGFNLGHIVVFPLGNYVVPQEYVSYLSLVLFLSAYLFYRFSYRFLETYFTRSKIN